MEEKSFAMELLQDYKKQSKRWFVIAILELIIILLFVSGLVYIVCNYNLSYDEATTDTGNAIISGEGNINAKSS